MTVLIIMRVFARGTPLRCARVRVDALTVRLNAINAPLDSCRLRARYRGERSSNRINRFVAPLRSRETVHCVTVREGSPALESSSRFFLILPCPLCVVAIRERGVHHGEGRQRERDSLRLKAEMSTRFRAKSPFTLRLDILDRPKRFSHFIRK